VARDAPVGRTVGGYELVSELGRGGMAIVYLARQIDLDRRVALKELSSFQAGSPDAAERFLREARLAGSLGHPNIVTVHEYFEQDGIPYIAMEYVERGSLRPYVGRLTLAQLAGVLEGVLAALAHAEQAQVIHRDLKPENVLVTGEGRVKIADFGIAKASQRAGMTAALTATGIAIGTPAYMAPEQAMAQPLGPSTDLYSVGLIAYEQLTGRPPFEGAESPMALLMCHVSETPTPVIAIRPEVDPALSAWIDRLLVKNPAERPQSAIEAWDSLEDIVIRLLGARWRREARLGDADDLGVSPSPLTPAPFTKPPDAPSSGPADEFVTYDPDRPIPAGPGAAPSREASTVEEPPRHESRQSETPPAPSQAVPSPTVTAAEPSGVMPAEPPGETEAPAPAPTDAGPGSATRSAASDAPTVRSRSTTASIAPLPVTPARRPRRALWLALAGLVALAGAVVAIVAAGSGGSGGSGSSSGSGGADGSGAGATTTQQSSTGRSARAAKPAGAPAAIATRSLPGGITVRGPIALIAGGTPAGLAVAGGDAWVADGTHNALVRVRADGSQVRVPVGRDPVAVAYEGSTRNVWVLNAGSADVTVVDGSGRVLRPSIKVGADPAAITVGSGAAWVANGGDGTVTRIDSRSFATRQIDLGTGPTTIADEYGRLWVGKRDLSITVLSGDGALDGRVRLPGSQMPLAISASNGVWVVRAGGGLTKVDPRTQVALVKTPPYQYAVHSDAPAVGGDPRDIDALEGSLNDNTIWVISKSDHLLSRIGTMPPHNNQVLSSVPLGETPDHVAVAPHVVWVSDPGRKALYEVTYP
jgi:serine/threonine protein kinase